MTELPEGVEVPKWHVLCKPGDVIPARLECWWYADTHKRWQKLSFEYCISVVTECIARPTTPLEIRAQAMEDACKAVCKWCGERNLANRSHRTMGLDRDNSILWWMHGNQPCAASAIREAFREEDE